MLPPVAQANSRATTRKPAERLISRLADIVNSVAVCCALTTADGHVVAISGRVTGGQALRQYQFWPQQVYGAVVCSSTRPQVAETAILHRFDAAQLTCWAQARKSLAVTSQAQDGIVARRQLIAAGLTPDQAVQGVRNRRWQVVGRGVYATFTGPIDPQARTCAALLAAGPGSVASHSTALWLTGLIPDEPSLIHISVPAGRHPRPRAGVRLHRRRDLDRLTMPTRPPRTNPEASVIDVAALAPSLGPVLSLVFTATQGRFTTAERLRAELARRGRHRWRRDLLGVLADIQDGVQSTLERRYLHDVERAHGLPRADRNHAERTRHGRRYRDARHQRYHLVIELDGKQAHPDSLRHRDLDRDNHVVVDEKNTVLRYGWHAVAITPCAVARQVATMLQRNGWTGVPRACPKCR